MAIINHINENKAWHKECSYAYFWETAPGIGSATIEKIFELYGSYQKMYEALEDGRIYHALGLCGELSEFKQRKKTLIKKHFMDWNVSLRYQEMIRQHIFCIPRFLNGFPLKLQEIDKAPSALFVKGKLPEENRPLVAIIGARNCSNYGVHMAKELGQVLAAHGIGVVSGLARGIDGIGQLAALNEGGATFGILGSGVDVCYPPENMELYKRLANGENRGGIISEMPPGTQAERNFFPMRNRIISGLADAIVVVEAKEKSGTFITVERALEQGKDVYACPGRVCDSLSIGCNRLISQGAGVIWNLDEFVQEVYQNHGFQININQDIEVNRTGGNQEKSMSSLTPVQQIIFHSLDYNMQPVDQILERVMKKHDILLRDLLIELSTMERLGYVRQENGFYGLAP